MLATKINTITTDLQLKNLKAKDQVYDVKFTHISGLVVRVSPKGNKSFRWDRGSKHKPRIITYGQYPNLSIKQAKKLHEEKQQQHKAGTLGIPNVAEPKNVTDLAELYYISKHNTLKRPDAIRQILDKDIIPVIGSIRLNTVNTMVIRNTVNRVIDRGAKSHAGKVLSILKSMFNFAMATGVLTNNPALPLTKDALGVVNNARNRVLTDEELKIFWQTIEGNKSKVTRIALQLLTLLGLRTGELRLSKWKDLDMQNKTLTILPANQKLTPKQLATAKPFVIPLDDFALSLFEKLRGLDDTVIFVGTTPEQPFSDKALSKYLARTIPKMDIEPFTPHDLRRTFRTGLSELGVEPHIAERCLNHSLGKILQTYDQHDFLKERRVALSLWSNHVQGCIS